MAKKRYSYDDDWADIEDYYGDNIDNPEINAPDIIETARKILNKDEKNLTEDDRDYLEMMYSQVGYEDITREEAENLEYIDHMVVEIEGEDGISMNYEVFGRIDIEDRVYLVVHRINDPDESSLKALRAWEDEEGYIRTCEIEDENELKEVEHEINLLISDHDDPNLWEDVPASGMLK